MGALTWKGNIDNGIPFFLFGLEEPRKSESRDTIPYPMPSLGLQRLRAYFQLQHLGLMRVLSD